MEFYEMNAPFTLDKRNGKLVGVCSGVARWADIDLFLVRLGAVATGIFFFPFVILMYLVAGWLAPQVSTKAGE